MASSGQRRQRVRAFGIMLASAVALFAVALFFMNRGTGMRE
jgi:predicted nucleic acid-binding Zn ribbon protein